MLSDFDPRVQTQMTLPCSTVKMVRPKQNCVGTLWSRSLAAHREHLCTSFRSGQTDCCDWCSLSCVSATRSQSQPDRHSSSVCGLKLQTVTLVAVLYVSRYTLSKYSLLTDISHILTHSEFCTVIHCEMLAACLGFFLFWCYVAPSMNNLGAPRVTASSNSASVIIS